MLDDDTRRHLLTLARLYAEARVLGLTPPATVVEVEVESPGVFVSVHRGARLRGCVGTFGTPKPLGRSVARLAAAACCDPRFAPVEAHEIPALTIQISVLTPPRRVHDVLEIAIGRDGLLVEEGERRGLLLPQVAVEHRWDREAFLGHTCLKAQLPRDAWRNGASIYRFEAEVFG